MDNDDTLLAECARALESLWVSSRGWTHEDRAREILRIIRPRIEAEALERAARSVEDWYSQRNCIAACRIRELIKESSRATGK
jgi:hypothetical protein